MDIQRACYGADYVETKERYARRLLSPVNCSLALVRGGKLQAYLAAYWSQAGQVTPLHGDFDASPGPEVLYLHDIAVHPTQAGQGLASRLLAPLWALAQHRGVGQSCLVAVQGSQGWWQRQGYRLQRLQDGAQLQHLAGYGQEAVYMQRVLPGVAALSQDADSGDNAAYA